MAIRSIFRRTKWTTSIAAGFEYQGDYSERSWAHTTFGYRVENENGFVGNLAYGDQTHGQRLNNDLYVQQQVTLGNGYR